MLKPVRPSAPIHAKYEARLVALVDEMHRSIVHWIAAEWRKNEPETVLLASDDTPVAALQAALNKLGRRWLSRFDDLSESLAE